VTGLNAEETVPITGFDKLQDGSKINIEGQTVKTSSASGQVKGGQVRGGQAVSGQ
jgi:hypothetical protein